MQQRAVEPSDLGHSSPVELDGFWARPAKQLLDALATSPAGLSAEEVALRRARYGPNLLARPRRGGSLALLVRQFTDPIVLLLVFAAVLAIVLGDLADASIILAIVGLSGLLGFWQERRAGSRSNGCWDWSRSKCRSAATARWSRSRPPTSCPAT